MGKVHTFTRLLALAAVLICPAGARAQSVLPHGYDVTAGKADFDYTSRPGTLNVAVGADKTIANWESYSVGAGNAVNYNRDSAFVFLNRVTGASVSNIFGSINAPNGKIFLVNPNGILFAPGSSVNAAGLAASTLNIKDCDFLAGRYTFYGKGGEVANRGLISTPGGYAVLLGGTVENTGVIEANLGSVILASGEKATLNLDPEGVISVAIDQKAAENLKGRDAAVSNTGRITANGGKVILTSGALEGVFNNAINNDGVIEARSIAVREGGVELAGDGNIVLGGTIDAGKGKVTLTSGGEIINSTATDAVKITAGDLSLKAVHGIGNSAPLYIDAQGLSAFNSKSGSVNIVGLSGLVARSVINNGGHAGDDISLKTLVGNIEVGRVSAAGQGNVALDSAAGITDENSDSLITADKLSLKAGSGGNSVGTLLQLGTGISTRVADGHQVLDIRNIPGAGSYNIYYRAGFSGPWQLVASNVAATGGKTTSWTDPAAALSGSFASYYAEVTTAATGAMGSAANRINTNANEISGLAGNAGGVYLNQATEVVLNGLHSSQGRVDVVANGKITAVNVTALGGNAGDDVSLKTRFGDIEVGTVGAAGAGNVVLDAAANITDNDGDSLVSANKVMFLSGVYKNPVGMQLQLGRGITTYVDGGHQVLKIGNVPGAGSYNIYWRAGFSGPWQLVASSVASSDGSTTVWTDPSAAVMGAFGSYYAEVVTSTTGAVGSSARRINTNVNDVSGYSRNTGDIYLNQLGAVTVSGLQSSLGRIDVTSGGDLRVVAIKAAGDVFLNSLSGSILGAGEGNHVTATGDIHLMAENLIGSWGPYAPFNVHALGDLFLTIGGRQSESDGSVGLMPVSGALSGTVAGAYHFSPGTGAIDPRTAGFKGDPSGYIFMNGVEIWPGARPGPGFDPDLLRQQLALDPRLRNIYDQDFRTVSIDRVTTTGVYFYHPLTLADSSAFDHIALDAGAYEFIDGNIELKDQNDFPEYYQLKKGKKQ